MTSIPDIYSTCYMLAPFIPWPWAVTDEEWWRALFSRFDVTFRPSLTGPYHVYFWLTHQKPLPSLTGDLIMSRFSQIISNLIGDKKACAKLPFASSPCIHAFCGQPLSHVHLSRWCWSDRSGSAFVNDIISIQQRYTKVAPFGFALESSKLQSAWHPSRKKEADSNSHVPIYFLRSKL
jgi:hypothetical protein